MLRAGEYTKPCTVMHKGKRVLATRKKKFVIGKVGFFKDGVIIPRNAPLPTLLKEYLATLKKEIKKMNVWDRR